MREILQASYAVHSLSDVQVSPDGRWIAWTEAYHDPAHLLESRRQHSVYEQPIAGGSPHKLTASLDAGVYDEENPVWSPDGRNLAFLSDARTPNQMQVFVVDTSDGSLRQLTHLKGDVQSLTWAPNGRHLAFLYIPDADRKSGALAPGARDVGVIGETIEEQRITTVDVATGALHLLSPASSYVYEYDWSPDSRQLAMTYARGNGDDNWWIAKLARIDARTGSVHDLLAPSYQMNDPVWSPDGKHVAIVGGLMSDFGIPGGDIYVVDVNDGTSRDVTPDAPFSAADLKWDTPRSLDVVAHVLGSMHLLHVDIATGARRTLFALPGSVWDLSSVRRGNVVAFVSTSFDRAPEIWGGSPSEIKRLTHRNPNAATYIGKAISIRWKSDDFRPQGWLIYPRSYDPSRRYPMVTIIHGGPSWESIPSFNSSSVSALSSRGYFVFFPNPRGSYGQGEAFTRANVKDFGYGDWRDDLSGVDAAVAAASIDPHCLGLFGWSYGGYMGMWAETQTTRFRAIVAGAGIFNWQSYYGENKIDKWMIPFFGKTVYQDPDVYARSSPITFVNNSKTPMLLLQGELDEEVPAPQAFECWHALKTLGVPVKLIVYAGEGHEPMKIADQIDIGTQTEAWFRRWLK